MDGSPQLITILRDWNELFMHHTFRDFMYSAKRRGLSMPQLGTLFQIGHHGMSGLTNIRGDSGVTSAAASQMLDRLVQEGLVKREEDPTDRRAKIIALTEKGRALIDESKGERQKWLIALASTLTEEEADRAAATLGLLVARVRELDAKNEREGAPERTEARECIDPLKLGKNKE
jgi:DNA-binding MarR family transcriptional regulator